MPLPYPARVVQLPTMPKKREREREIGFPSSLRFERERDALAFFEHPESKRSRVYPFVRYTRMYARTSSGRGVARDDLIPRLLSRANAELDSQPALHPPDSICRSAESFCSMRFVTRRVARHSLGITKAIVAEGKGKESFNPRRTRKNHPSWGASVTLVARVVVSFILSCLFVTIYVHRTRLYYIMAILLAFHLQNLSEFESRDHVLITDCESAYKFYLKHERCYINALLY